MRLKIAASTGQRSMTRAGTDPNRGQSIPACPLCQGRELELKFPGILDRLGIVDGQFDFHSCKRCKSVSLIPLPDAADVPGFYPASYMVKSPPSNGGLLTNLRVAEWHTFFLPVYRSGARSVLEMTGIERGRLLEIGSSSGYQLREFGRSSGLELVGLDIDELAVDHARNELGLNVINSTLEGAQFPESSFDLVILFNVLEHLVRPIELLQEVSRILKPGGFLAIKTQIINSIQSRLFGRRWMLLHEAPRHVLLASTEGIRQAVDLAGMDLVDYSSGPVLESSVSVALSMMPNATSGLAFGKESLLGGLITRLAGIVLTALSVPYVILEGALDLSGTMIYIATKDNGKLNSSRIEREDPSRMITVESLSAAARD